MLFIQPVYFNNTEDNIEEDLKYRQHREENINAMKASNPDIPDDMIKCILNKIDNFVVTMSYSLKGIDDDTKSHLLKDISHTMEQELFIEIFGYDPFE